ncbi:MAG: hypothetical protein ACJ746_24730 [Bryobacteraceae bacterium]
MFHRPKMLSIFLLTALMLNAQHEAHSSEKPVALLDNLGSYSHRIRTSKLESQQFFDQGLGLLYGFNRYEALRSFRRSAELDPGAVMPLLGVAMALGPHINMDSDGDFNNNASCEALSKARQLAASGSVYEQAYVQAIASRCPTYDPDRYIDRMRRLHEQYPDDLDAATLYAESIMIPVRWQWWQADGLPAPGMAQAVSVLEQVMRRNPIHPGANHFYIHAVEMSPSPERAIPSAYRLMGIMPAAGHIIHMPAHIWVILGEWEIAATLNERAAQADRDYFARTGVQSNYLGYYIHNLHFVAYARAMQGRADDAINAADRMVTECAAVEKAMPEMVDAFSPYGIFTRVRFGRWDDMLALPKPHAKLVASNAFWHWGRAIALAGKGERRAASREAGEFRIAKSNVPAQWSWMNSKASDALALGDAILEARLERDDHAALEHWRRAVALQDHLRYDEPPAWFMPVRESLGAALLRAGDAVGAETVFREGIRRSVRDGRMLFGLWKSLEAQGKTDAVSLVREEFNREWERADVKIRIDDM